MNRRLPSALAAVALAAALSAAAAAAPSTYPPLPSVGTALSSRGNAPAPAIPAGQLAVQAPPVEPVTVGLTADSIQPIVADPALGVGNMDIVLIDLPRVAFSRPVPIMGAAEGQQDFFLTAMSADAVCRAFGYGPHAGGSYSIYIPVKAGQVLMALDSNLYQVRTLIDGDFSYIRSLACKAR